MLCGSYLSFSQKQQRFILGSIVVSIPACHAGDRGSIPRRGEAIFSQVLWQRSQFLQWYETYIFILEVVGMPD